MYTYFPATYTRDHQTPEWGQYLRRMAGELLREELTIEQEAASAESEAE
jgi:hypothetical protein